MNGRSLVKIGLAASVSLLLLQPPTAFADTGSELQQQIRKDQQHRQEALNKVQDKKAELNANQNQQSVISHQVQELELQIQASNNQILSKRHDIETQKKNLETLKNNIAMLEKRIQDRKELIKERARTAYMNGGSINYLELLVDAQNFYDFINRMVFINKIAEQDRAILQKQMKDQKELEKNQKVLKETLAKLNEDLQNLEALMATLKSKQAKQQTLLSQLKEQAGQITQALSSNLKQAEHYKQLEAQHRAELAEWERQLKQDKNIPSVIRLFVAPAQQLEKSTGIPTSITLAQIILESGSQSLSQLAREGKNLFGIKGTGPAGTIYLTTHEVINGTEITVEAGFKRYHNYYECLVDHANVLLKPRYQTYLKNAHSLEEYAYGIQDGGYSTDPTYAIKLLTIIKDYGLSRYDLGSF
jgi:peptidoglycan hydrolase CwlO-like protein